MEEWWCSLRIAELVELKICERFGCGRAAIPCLIVRDRGSGITQRCQRRWRGTGRGAGAKWKWGESWNEQGTLMRHGWKWFFDAHHKDLSHAHATHVTRANVREKGTCEVCCRGLRPRPPVSLPWTFRWGWCPRRFALHRWKRVLHAILDEDVAKKVRGAIASHPHFPVLVTLPPGRSNVRVAAMSLPVALQLVQSGHHFGPDVEGGQELPDILNRSCLCAADSHAAVNYRVFRLSRTLSGLGGPKNFIY